MATISSNNILFAGISGTVGNLVFSNWKGKRYVHSKPVKISNPRTAAQINQRARFTTVIQFLQPLKAFLRIGFKSKTSKMSEFNAAMSYNLKNAISGTYPDFGIDYSRAMVSRGNLPGALDPEVKVTTEGEIEFIWRNNSIVVDAMADDMVLLLVYNRDKQQELMEVEGNTRSEGSQMVPILASLIGDDLFCFIAFRDAGNSKVSDSKFTGGPIVI